jgi:hypothetical protein
LAAAFVVGSCGSEGNDEVKRMRADGIFKALPHSITETNTAVSERTDRPIRVPRSSVDVTYVSELSPREAARFYLNHAIDAGWSMYGVRGCDLSEPGYGMSGQKATGGSVITLDIGILPSEQGSRIGVEVSGPDDGARPPQPPSACQTELQSR